MRVSKFPKVIVMILSLMVLAGLSACLGTGVDKISTRYYLIDPVETPALSFNRDHPLAIEIIDVHVPQYLERFHVVTRTGKDRLNFSESNQWGENLRKNLMRTLSRNLSRMLSTQDIGTPLRRSLSSPDYRVQIYIEQFERDIDHQVKLSARWQISAGESLEPLGIYNKDMESPALDENDYDQMVATMAQMYGELSKNIAESIIVEENKRP